MICLGLLFTSLELVSIVNKARNDLLVDRVEHDREKKAGKERASKSLNVLGQEPEGHSVEESLEFKT